MTTWLKKLTKADRKHLRENCVINEGLNSKTLAIERATEAAALGCWECRAILHKLET